jgi:hypothetical protein
MTTVALLCQHKIARTIAKNWGDYRLQVKGNPPHLEQLAQQSATIPCTPFFEESEGRQNRLAIRALHAFTTNAKTVDFPFARSLVIVHCRCVHGDPNHVTRELYPRQTHPCIQRP